MAEAEHLSVKRRILGALAALVFVLLSVGYAVCDEAAQYTARATTKFHLASKPGGKYWVASIPRNGTLLILELEEESCLALYGGVKGYCSTALLYEFRSMDPYLYPLPENPCAVTGYVTAQQDLTIRSEKFSGTTLAAGGIVFAMQDSSGLCELPVWREKQPVRSEEAVYQPFVPWTEAAAGDVISGFTTYYSDRLGRHYPQQREYNIQLGCERINGTVLQPDDVFSFNALCAPYSRKNGYELAPNISSSGVGYGGGICQVSTTLYNALLPLPLKIEKWRVHRIDGVDYVPQYFDAAVGRSPNLEFRNTLPYAIQLHASAGNGIVNVYFTREG